MIFLIATLLLIVSIGWSQWRASKKILYFAYGVNTNKQTFKQRVPSARYRSTATLDGYEFRWKQHAAILPKAGSTVHGVVWEIDRADLKDLDDYEFNYRRETVQVCSNRTLNAEAYFMTIKESTADDIDDYVDMVRLGYKEHGLPLEQLESSSGSCTNPPSSLR